MEDEYLRERKADLEQVAERILRYMKGVALAGGAAHAAALGARRQQDLLLRRQHRRAAGAGGARPVAGRHAAVQAERVRRLRHRRRRQDLAHRHRRAQHGHPGGGGRAQRQPAGAAGRLGHHRRRRRRDDRRPLADHPGRVRLQAAPGRARARPPLAPAAHAGRHARRPEGRAAGQHRDARRRAGRADGRRGGRGPVPQRIPVHGPQGPTCPTRTSSTQAYRRAVEGMQGLPVTIRTIDVGADKPLDDIAARRGAPEPRAGPARDPLEPGRPGDVPHPAARHPARRRARQGQPAGARCWRMPARSARRCRCSTSRAPSWTTAASPTGRCSWAR